MAAYFRAGTRFFCARSIEKAFRGINHFLRKDIAPSLIDAEREMGAAGEEPTIFSWSNLLMPIEVHIPARGNNDLRCYLVIFDISGVIAYTNLQIECVSAEVITERTGEQ